MDSNPALALRFDKEVIQNTKTIHDNHLSTKGNHTKIWPGEKKFTDEELKEFTKINYFERNPQKIKKVRSEYPTYERIFCSEPGWDMYMPRDDRQSIRNIGERFYKEEDERNVPVLTSSLYGKSFMGPLEVVNRVHARRMQIPSFYRINDVGLPPLRRA